MRLLLLPLLLISAVPMWGASTVRESAAPCLRVRVAPATTTDVIMCLAPGTTVDILDHVPYWRHVRTADGTTGWAAARFLEQTSDEPPSAGNDWLTIHIVDVGQGDGIWISTPDDLIDGNGTREGKNVVIDAGPDQAADRNAMLKYLLAYAHADAVIDAVILTHPHLDHYGGLRGIFDKFAVNAFYDAGLETGRITYDRLLNDICRRTPCIRPVLAGSSLDLGSEIDARFLWTYEPGLTGFGSGNTLENNASLVLRLQYGDAIFLFMGDAEGKDRGDPPAIPQYVEKHLIDTNAQLRAQVLKIAHHGSETSSTLPFMQAVQPTYVVISSGRTSFGGTFLPDASVLRRYCQQNPDTIFLRTDYHDAAEKRTTTTDADGDHVIIRTNGTHILVTQLSGGVTVPPTTCRDIP